MFAVFAVGDCGGAIKGFGRCRFAAGDGVFIGAVSAGGRFALSPHAPADRGFGGFGGRVASTILPPNP